MPYQVTLSEGGSPSCAGVYTDHIEYNGQMSYTCTNDEGTWYLYYLGGTLWMISETLGSSKPLLGWRKFTSVEVSGTYNWAGTATGTATVAEYVPPTSDPRLRGVLKLLITHVNGTELNPSKRFELEFDS